jgi:hypothetical protein
MNLIPLNIDNVQQATDYLASIGKLQEFNEKKIEASQWSAVILFANQQIQIQNANQQNGLDRT